MFYLEFCQALNLELTPTQAEFAFVAFDAGDPLAGSQLWGWAECDPRARAIVGAVCGRDSGKSRLGAARLLHLAITVPLDALAPRETAYCPIIAPDMATGRHTLAFAMSAAQQLIPNAIISSNSNGFVIKRERDRKVAIQVYAASAGGRSVRGRSFCGVLLEECAFFRDSSYRINDQDIWNAISPRILPEGQAILLSTPWAKSGLLYNFYRDNYGHPDYALIAHAPTISMRDNDPDIVQIVARERRRDPMNASREFDAEFLSTDGSTYFDSRAIDASIREIPPKPVGAVVTAGADLGFVHDSSALAIVWRHRDQYVLQSLTELTPQIKPLVPSEVVQQFASESVKAGAEYVIADGHYRETLREAMNKTGLSLINCPEGAQGKAEMFATFRNLLNEGRITLIDNDRLLRQLQETVSRPQPGGGMSIQTPRWTTGGHGDLVSAVVSAVWKASKYAFAEIKLESEPGTPQYYAEQIQKRKSTILRKHKDDEYWDEVI